MFDVVRRGPNNAWDEAEHGGDADAGPAHHGHGINGGDDAA